MAPEVKGFVEALATLDWTDPADKVELVGRYVILLGSPAGKKIAEGVKETFTVLFGKEKAEEIFSALATSVIRGVTPPDERHLDSRRNRQVSHRGDHGHSHVGH